MTTADGSAVQVRRLHASDLILAAGRRWKLNSWMSPWFYAVFAVLEAIGWA